MLDTDGMTALAEPIPLIDLQAQRKRIDAPVRAAMQRVLEHGKYILGPEVAEFERELAAFAGARLAVGCSSGTDALALVLMGLGIRAGDAVLMPTFTFAATAEVVAWLGATPVFLDVRDDTFNLDTEQLEEAYALARREGLSPKGVISVDLFGQPADYEAIEAFCTEAGLWLMSDAAQSFGARHGDRKVGTIGLATATSFFPAKPLGCYGDGGAVLLEDETLAEILRSLRVHGQGRDKYENVRIGMNGRLDTLQAAILLEKLAVFPEELDLRQQVADRYAERLAPLENLVTVPTLAAGNTSAWAQYTIRLPADMRDRVAAALSRARIASAIYYPVPLHRQPAYGDYPSVAGSDGTAERLAREVLSLPMHPYLDADSQDRVVETVAEALKAQ